MHINTEQIDLLASWVLQCVADDFDGPLDVDLLMSFFDSRDRDADRPATRAAFASAFARLQVRGELIVMDLHGDGSPWLFQVTPEGARRKATGELRDDILAASRDSRLFRLRHCLYPVRGWAFNNPRLVRMIPTRRELLAAV